MTDRTGEYSVALSPGDYHVDVTRFGYDDVAMTVQIRAGEIVRKDLELVESPRVRVRGRVTDGSGHGWPLYARVDVPGTPLRTFSDPETGRYELDRSRRAQLSVADGRPVPGLPDPHRGPHRRRPDDPRRRRPGRPDDLHRARLRADRRPDGGLRVQPHDRPVERRGPRRQRADLGLRRPRGSREPDRRHGPLRDRRQRPLRA